MQKPEAQISMRKESAIAKAPTYRWRPRAVGAWSLVLFPLLSVCPSSFAATWAAWRGDGTGLSLEKHFPIEWSDTKNVRWKVPVPGYGWSCPVIAGDRIFLTTAISQNQKAPLRRGPGRSEERRVGKEYRCRRLPNH